MYEWPWKMVTSKNIQPVLKKMEKLWKKPLLFYKFTKISKHEVKGCVDVSIFNVRLDVTVFDGIFNLFSMFPISMFQATHFQNLYFTLFQLIPVAPPPVLPQKSDIAPKKPKHFQYFCVLESILPNFFYS